MTGVAIRAPGITGAGGGICVLATEVESIGVGGVSVWTGAG